MQAERISRSKTKKGKALKTCKVMKNHWQIYLMMLPAILAILIFSYKPMYGIIIAFKKYSFRLGILGSPWVGFANFRELFNSYWFPIVLKNTLSISLVGLLGFPNPIIFALMLNELKNSRIKHTVQTISYAPHFISTVVVCGMVILFLSQKTGIVNRLIVALGGDAIQFMGKPYMFKWIYAISGSWQGLGWSSIIYVAALSGVEPELLEAAEIDGASRLQKIWYVNLPVLVPTIMILFILTCGRLLSVGYEKVFALQNAQNIMGSEVISTYSYKTGLVNSNFSFSTAVGLFNSAVNSIILIAANMLSRRLTDSGLF